MASSGYVNTNSYNGLRLQLSWSVPGGGQSAENNQTKLNWTLRGTGQITESGTNWYSLSNVTAAIDGRTVYSRKENSFMQLRSGTVVASGSITLDHETDGTRSFTASVRCGIYVWDVNCTGSGKFELNTIPRASTIGATDANIGAVSMIAVSRKSEAYTHSVQYRFGDLTGYILADGSISEAEVKHAAASIAFALPADFYTQIPNAKSGLCILTCRTYSEETQIADAQTAQFTVTAAELLCAPVVSGVVADSNEVTKALTGDDKKLVRFCSDAFCTITAEARNSATVAQRKIDGAAVEGDTRTIAGVEATSIVFAAVDSRGYETSVSVEYELIPYVRLTSNPAGARTDPTSGNAILTVTGNYYNGSFGAQDNALTVRYRVAPRGGEYGEYVTVEAALDGNTYSVEAGLTDLDYEQSFDIEVVVSDKLSAVTKVGTIKQGIPVFNWGKNHFRFNAPLVVSEKSFGTELPERGKRGQLFFLQNGDGTHSVYIHNGTSWK